MMIPLTAFATPTESSESLEWKPGEKINYLQFLPEGYDKDSAEAYPLVIFLHGSGERGDNLDLIRKHGPPMMATTAMKNQGHGLPFILAAPQCPMGRWWNTDEVIALTKHLAKSLHVDEKRIHLTGISMGGFGTWACLTQEPDLYASGVPICGGGEPAQAEKIKDIPIWTFHGLKDDAVPVAKTQEMEKAIHDAGGKKLLVTYYPEEHHESWIPAYADPSLLAWMMLQHKK
ncbi:prolyl oligopeptidase family serine peptidase [Haloferula sp. BvORR071]|uniref:carboxylesterase family protein n=1 Tax=Haloferula sp. BvORR071 TaxID=1396141 RepID=UPI002240ED4A|nr:prolyl oligopeptidase family serine peptidase [Haloferula sp. BvORR071]